MTRTARYNAETNTFRELPRYIKPVWEVTHWNYTDYGSAKVAYDAHLASLREIPCHESCRSVFKDQQVYEEGKDYERVGLFIGTKEEGMYAVPLLANSDEHKLWDEMFCKYFDQKFEGVATPIIVENLMKEYTLTPR